MKNYSLFPLILSAVFAISCNYTGTPVEYANICDKANDDKLVEVVGFLDNKGSSVLERLRPPDAMSDRL